MRRLLFLVAILVLLAAPVYASGNKPILGVVVDATTKQPVAFATVALKNKADGILAGVNTDVAGKFTIPNVAPGEYKLFITYVGYTPKTQPIKVPEAGESVDLGSIELAAAELALKEVEISVERPLVEDTDDGYVYNAENDASATGGTAADLLTNVPGLTLGADGNLEMMGTTKIKVLMDGKPSSIMAGDMAEALRQIPADIIAKVEVITTPSAKYDAEGTGGVINIITKKNKQMKGYNGSASITGGNRGKSGGINFYTRTGKLNLRSSLNGSTGRDFGDNKVEQVYYKGRIVNQDNEFTEAGAKVNGHFVGELDLNEKNSLRATVKGVNTDSDTDQRNLSIERSSKETDYGREINRNLRLTDKTKGIESIDANLDYTRYFKQKNQELSLMMMYSGTGRKDNNLTTRQNANDVINLVQHNDNSSTNDELTFQIDYVHPFKKLGRIETGAKAILRDATSNYLVSSASSWEEPLQEDTRRTNVFNYHQDVFSGYFSHTLSINKKYTLRTGGRYEYTTIDANFVSSGTSMSKTYLNFMPNINLSMRLKKDQRVAVSYSSRIHRPQIHYLNPFFDDTNERNIRVGNPDLLPEVSHNTTLSYSRYINQLTLKGTAYWRQTNNDISSYRSFDRRPSRVAPYDSIDAIITSFMNVGKNSTVGASLSVTLRLNKSGNIGTTLGAYHSQINGVTYNPILKTTELTTRSGMVYNWQVNGTYRFQKDVVAQLSTSLSSPRLQAQGSITMVQKYNVSLRKDFWNRTASLGFTIDNFLSNKDLARQVTNADLFTSTNWRYSYNRVYRLSLTYRFKKMEFKERAPKDHKTIVNDDKEKAVQ
ncbi:TonB-dependent receptor domain-containing protein [Pontibacter mangrovi]|uniref:TonB-dependent receptor n=1 Tax=Pontibacter mangrovi TaxID=2589816 RepID=A0A501W7G9_9BACT|nr:outer membrane beta-barrel family protein [Pontibacter mangrovi]TPE44024.1 TonB-dependent receptor [Pontibacter mangrovi]